MCRTKRTTRHHATWRRPLVSIAPTIAELPWGTSTNIVGCHVQTTSTRARTSALQIVSEGGRFFLNGK